MNIPLSAFGNRILRRIPVLLIAGVLAAIGASFFQAQSPPSYRATASVLVGPSHTDPQMAEDPAPGFTAAEAQLSRQLVETYVDLIESQSVARIVAERLDLDPQSLTGTIDAYQRSDSLIIPIHVDHRDPDMAVKISQEVVEATRQRAIEILRIDHLTQVDMPTRASLRSPTRSYALALGAAAGILLSMLIVSFIPTKPESIGDV
ncbi:MAG: Wzz/FepE/Etk N-terminal domain-containing protein [Tissierellia bacterium]|nr:Wzz/FepE/Etk N-terminal domain-containing protein [Tissierellia bacterium]